MVTLNHIAGKFGGGKVWQIDSFWGYGERKLIFSYMFPSTGWGDSFFDILLAVLVKCAAFRTFIRNIICQDLLTCHTACNVSYPIVYAVFMMINISMKCNYYFQTYSVWQFLTVHPMSADILVYMYMITSNAAVDLKHVASHCWLYSDSDRGSPTVFKFHTLLVRFDQKSRKHEYWVPVKSLFQHMNGEYMSILVTNTWSNKI